jgi:hypothetical protein
MVQKNYAYCPVMCNTLIQCVLPDATKGLFGSTQFLKNWFMETGMVPTIPVFDPVSGNWFISFLETKKLGSTSKNLILVSKLQCTLVGFEIFIGISH